MKKLKLKRTSPTQAQLDARERNYTLFRLAGVQSHIRNIQYLYRGDIELQKALTVAADAITNAAFIVREKRK